MENSWNKQKNIHPCNKRIDKSERMDQFMIERIQQKAWFSHSELVTKLLPGRLSPQKMVPIWGTIIRPLFDANRTQHFTFGSKLIFWDNYKNTKPDFMTEETFISLRIVYGFLETSSQTEIWRNQGRFPAQAARILTKFPSNNSQSHNFPQGTSPLVIT